MSVFRSFLRYFGLAEEPAAESRPSSEPWPVGDPVATLERLRDEAAPIPLTNEVRVDRERAYEAIEELRRRALGTTSGTHSLDRLHDLIANAKPVPLTDQVRVERNEFGELVTSISAGA